MCLKVSAPILQMTISSQMLSPSCHSEVGGMNCILSFFYKIDISVAVETDDEKSAVWHVRGIINDLIFNSLRCSLGVCAHEGLPFSLYQNDMFFPRLDIDSAIKHASSLSPIHRTSGNDRPSCVRVI